MYLYKKRKVSARSLFISKSINIPNIAKGEHFQSLGQRLPLEIQDRYQKEADCINDTHVDYSIQENKHATLNALKRVTEDIWNQMKSARRGWSMWSILSFLIAHFQCKNGKIGCAYVRDAERYCGPFEDFVNDPQDYVPIKQQKKMTR